MKQLPRAEAEQRKIKWVFEVFRASLHYLVHFLAQLLRHDTLFSTGPNPEMRGTKEKNRFYLIGYI